METAKASQSQVEKAKVSQIRKAMRQAQNATWRNETDCIQDDPELAGAIIRNHHVC